MSQTNRRPRTAVLVFALALASTLLPCSAVRAEAPKGDKYALLIAVNQYDKNELRDLPYAEDDIKALADVLRKAGYRRVVVMSPSEGAKQARFLPVAANIRKMVKGFVEDRTADDGLLFAFVGHGVQFKGEDESYFCPMDAKLGDKETLISLGAVYKELEKCDAGMRLLIVDACRNDPRSKELRSMDKIKLETVPQPQKRLPPGGVAALFSCSAGQRAYENSTLNHGVFFQFLVEGLRGKADLDGDGQVGLDELVRYTQRQVSDYVKEAYGDDVRQMPELVGKTRAFDSLARVESGDKPAAPKVDRIEVGCRVFCRWLPDGLWYPGTVKNIKNQTYLIHFDIRFDDIDQAWVKMGDVTTSQPVVGDRIECDWLAKGLFYKGKVTERRGEKVHILYDDGDEEDTTISYLRAAYDGLVLPKP